MVKLSSITGVDYVAKGYSNFKEKSVIWGRHNLIRRICHTIKEKYEDVVLAVISESNSMAYLNENGKIRREASKLNPITDTFLVFVRDTQKGREFVDLITRSPQSFFSLSEEQDV